MIAVAVSGAAGRMGRLVAETVHATEGMQLVACFDPGAPGDTVAGVLVSDDPVAIDQAALDLVNAAPSSYPSALPAGLASGEDKFRAMHPDIDGTYALAYAEKLGLGRRTYELINV